MTTTQTEIRDAHAAYAEDMRIADKAYANADTPWAVAAENARREQSRRTRDNAISTAHLNAHADAAR